MECVPTNALIKLYLHFTIALRTFRSQIDNHQGLSMHVSALHFTSQWTSEVKCTYMHTEPLMMVNLWPKRT
jgi:hypothetical protein